MNTKKNKSGVSGDQSNVVNVQNESYGPKEEIQLKNIGETSKEEPPSENIGEEPQTSNYLIKFTVNAQHNIQKRETNEGTEYLIHMIDLEAQEIKQCGLWSKFKLLSLVGLSIAALVTPGVVMMIKLNYNEYLYLCSFICLSLFKFLFGTWETTFGTDFQKLIMNKFGSKVQALIFII